MSPDTSRAPERVERKLGKVFTQGCEHHSGVQITNDPHGPKLPSRALNVGVGPIQQPNAKVTQRRVAAFSFSTFMIRFVVSAAISVSCGFRISGQPAVPTNSSPTQSRAEQRRALLVGISDYDRGTNPDDGFGKLNTGPDISNMSYVLKTYYAFPEANISVLQNESATQENIILQFRRQLIDKAKPGDQIVFYYTGHGHQVIDISGDETTDHLDEVLVTWVPKNKQTLPPDQRHAVMYMLDDTYESLLHELAQKMKGANGKVEGSITIIFDSCHSGSATKGVMIAKGRPWDEKIDGRLPPVTKPNESASGWLSRKDEFDGVVFLAASQSGQLSYMMPGIGNKGSILTYELTEFLTRIAREKTTNITYRQMFDNIAPTVSGMRANQDPQIEGPINTLLFGDGQTVKVETLPVVRRVLTTPVRVELSEGSLHGVTPGSRYDLYRSGKDVKNPANKLAELEISDVDSTTSIATITKINTPVQQPSEYLASQAVATEVRFDGKPLKVLIQSDLPVDKALVLSNAVRDLTFVSRADVTETNFDAKLGWCADGKIASCKDNQGRYFFQRANGSTVSLGAIVEATSLQQRLLADWRWKRLADLILPGPPKVRIDMVAQDGSPIRRTEGGRIQLKPGDNVKVRCTNNTGSPVFITLIYLKNSGDIEVYPSADITNAQQALSGDNQPVELFSLTDVTAPNGKEVEILKIIATPRQTDFTGLHFVGEERKGKSKGPKNPLADLLFGIIDANAKSGTIKPAEISNWYTDQVVYEITPN